MSKKLLTLLLALLFLSPLGCALLVRPTRGHHSAQKCPPGHVWSDGKCHDRGKGHDENKHADKDRRPGRGRN